MGNFFSVRTKAFENLDQALQHILKLKIDLGPPPPPPPPPPCGLEIMHSNINQTDK